MSWCEFNRGSFNMKYSPDFVTEIADLYFLKASVLKNVFNNINYKSESRGVQKEKKDDIINKLCSLMLKNRHIFW